MSFSSYYCQDDSYLALPIVIITLWYALFMEQNIIIQIFLLIIALTTLSLIIITPLYITPFLERKKNHKTSLYNKVLRKYHSMIALKYPNYSIVLDETSVNGLKEYEWMFQHLRKKHRDITDNYDNTQSKITEINSKLSNINVDISQRIKKENIDKKYKSTLLDVIWDILIEHIKGNKSLDILNITKMKSKVELQYQQDRHRYIVCSGNETEISNLFKKIKDDKKFRNKIKEIENLKQEFKVYFSGFKKNLENLLHKIDNNGISELKGSCDECSFWKINLD